MTGGCGDPTCDDCATEWGRVVEDERLACPECGRQTEVLCECEGDDQLCWTCHVDWHVSDRYPERDVA